MINFFTQSGNSLPAATGGLPIGPTFLNLEYFFTKILDIARAIKAFFTNNNFFSDTLPFILGILAVLFIAIICYCIIRIMEIRKKEHDHLLFKLREAQERKEESKGGDHGNSRWQEVEKHIGADSEASWRMAIIEADAMLDEMTIDIGLPGENLGERLKFAQEHRPFNTLDNAWKAHTVRNKIAHEGSEYQLSSLDARRTIGLYQTVFNEFKII